MIVNDLPVPPAPPHALSANCVPDVELIYIASPHQQVVPPVELLLSSPAYAQDIAAHEAVHEVMRVAFEVD